MSRRLMLNSLFIILILSAAFFLGQAIIINPIPISLVLPANTTPTSTTMVWYTPTPTFGCIITLSLPPRLGCDPQGKPVTNHFVTLNNLSPHKPYTLLIASNWRIVRYKLEPKFIPEAVPAPPNPAYGQVLQDDAKTPAAQATVIITTQAGPVATLTNDQGRFTLDLRGSYPPNTPLTTQLMWADKYIKRQQIITGVHQPTPPIILEEPFKNEN